MFGRFLSIGKRSGQRVGKSTSKGDRSSIYQRLLRCEPLEDRRLLSGISSLSGQIVAANASNSGGPVAKAAAVAPAAAPPLTLTVSSATEPYGQDFQFTATSTDESAFTVNYDFPLVLVVNGEPVIPPYEGTVIMNWDTPYAACGWEDDNVLHPCQAGTNNNTAYAYAWWAASDEYVDSNTLYLSVTPVPLLLTANNATKKVGYADPTFSVTGTGFMYSDNVGSVSGPDFYTSEPQPPTSAPVGTYTITPYGATANNYSPISYAKGTLTVTPDNNTTTTLALSPNVSSRTYGTPITLTATVTSTFATPEDGTVTFDNGSTALGTVNLGSGGGAVNQAIFTPTDAELGADTYSFTANYSGDVVSYIGSSSSASPLTVNKATLTVTANNMGKCYGTADPIFSASYAGFVGSDGPGNLTGTLGFTTNEPQPVTTAPVGSYRITFTSGYGSSNYNIVYDPGTLTVLSPGTCVGSGAFNGSGSTDLLWQNQSSGLVALALVNSGAISNWVALGYAPPTQWKLAGTGNFTGNGTSDILWINTTNGEVGEWLINNAAVSGWVTMSYVDLGTWSFKGVGDFNGDGTSDLLWENSSGVVGAWLIKNSVISAWDSMPYADPTQWSIIGLGDFNGDGTSDVLWQNTVNGAVGAWLMSSGSVSGWLGLGGASPSAWKVVAVSDLNNKGVDDLLWESLSTPGVYGAWLVQGSTCSWASLPYVDTSQWEMLGVANVVGGATSNAVVWENLSSGVVGAWGIENAAVAGWWQLGCA